MFLDIINDFILPILLLYDEHPFDHLTPEIQRGDLDFFIPNLKKHWIKKYLVHSDSTKLACHTSLSSRPTPFRKLSKNLQFFCGKQLFDG